MPFIDTAKLPAAAVPYTAARVQAANVADPSQLPVASDVGAFREACNFSHMSFDDPIVYPGKSGVSHLHTFFGNSGTDANSTATSIATSGGSTCAGGTLNRTGYWIPAMIDTKDGSPVVPAGSLIYYKTGYLGVRPADVKAPPAGLRMIAGSAQSAADQGNVARYACVGSTVTNSMWTGYIQGCPAGSQLIMEVSFPQCWDGVNLDSPDHKSHMAYASNGCPSDHPVALPNISYEIHYDVTDSTQASRWRLSSDNYNASLPAGYSAHGDYFMGWDAATMNTIVAKCLNLQLDCHAYLLGDGRTLY
jgi:Domain of unknown function (DUF1996)